MKEKKLFSFSELAKELKMEPEELSRIIDDSGLPIPSIYNRLTGECFFNEADYNNVREGLEASEISREEFFNLFGSNLKKRFRSAKKARKKSIKIADLPEDSAPKRRRGRPPKNK